MRVSSSHQQSINQRQQQVSCVYTSHRQKQEINRFSIPKCVVGNCCIRNAVASVCRLFVRIISFYQQKVIFFFFLPVCVCVHYPNLVVQQIVKIAITLVITWIPSDTDFRVCVRFGSLSSNPIFNQIKLIDPILKHTLLACSPFCVFL